MKFLLDENFPKAAGEILKRRGHEVYDFRGIGELGADDSVLVEMAREIGAVILTTDRDYFHTLPQQFPDHAGVIVIAIKQPNRAAILERLEWLLQHVGEDHLSGRAIQLRDRTWVARPPLPESSEEGGSPL